ncbi:glutamate 5-kinase isoform X1 [Chlorella sorokiniana]|uniref:Isopentenyl phosphate kinase n=1 Tax=Chlorella sorokiniana TaxID=3076 RepID=A0A2P6TW12_CHLSO|nr:glutamate 5-kinase isoform X1 [Chlorella sorokiniana]|eukprot:PRW58253.1 glutamate 5-kinase isoform X1 [Chlorella sorokiniana]
MADPPSPRPDVAVIIKLGGAAITHKQQLETLNREVLAASVSQLAALYAAIGPCFVVVHGAGSFGHQAAAAAGVAGGGIQQSTAVRQGFAATRASVTKLNQLVVAALVAAGVPAVGVSPCPGWTTSGRQVATDGCAGVAALLAAGLVPVLHGDAVLDRELGCTILSGDVLVTRLCQAFRPPVVAFLTNVPGIYDRPPAEPGAQLIARLECSSAADHSSSADGGSSRDGSGSGGGSGGHGATCSLPCGAVAYAADGAAVDSLLTSSAAHDTTGGVATKIREAAAVARLGAELAQLVVCPITQEPMQDPACAADGGTYERDAIATWFARQQAAGQAPTSPLTGLPLANCVLQPNRMVLSLKDALADAGLMC